MRLVAIDPSLIPSPSYFLIQTEIGHWIVSLPNALIAFDRWHIFLTLKQSDDVYENDHYEVFGHLVFSLSSPEKSLTDIYCIKTV